MKQLNMDHWIAGGLVVTIGWLVFWFGGVHISHAWIAYAFLGFLGILTTLAGNSSPNFLPNDYWAKFCLFCGLIYIILIGSISPVKYFSIAQLSNIAPFLIVFTISIRINSQGGASTFILGGIIVIGIATSTYSIYQMLTDSPMVLWETKPSVYNQRFGSTFINPNHHAAFLILSLPLLLSFIIVRPTSALQRVLLSLAALGMIFSLYITKSRGGWIGSVTSLILLGCGLWRRYTAPIRTTIIIGLILVMGSMTYISSSGFRERLQGTFSSNTDQSGLFRFWLWSPIIRMWLDQPLLGVGPGHFNVRFPAYRTALTQLNPIHAHNEYLEALVEYGLIGFIIILAFLARIAIKSAHIFKITQTHLTNSFVTDTKNWHHRFLVIGSTAGLAGFAAHSLFEFNMRIPAVALTAATLAGTLVGNLNKNQINTSEPKWYQRRMFYFSIFALGFLVSTPIWFYYAREDKFIYRAMHRRQDTIGLISDLRSAASVMPNNPDTQFWIGEEIRRSLFESNLKNQYQVKDALVWLNRSAGLNPYNARTRMTIGRCYLMSGQTNTAIVMLESAYKMSPFDTLTINPLAGTYLKIGNLTEARRLVDLSLSINDWNNQEATFYHNILVDVKTTPPISAPNGF
jgi:O-antigen ligase